MTKGFDGVVLGQLRTLFDDGAVGGLSDGDSSTIATGRARRRLGPWSIVMAHLSLAFAGGS
jgi:hypothetical protein